MTTTNIPTPAPVAHDVQACIAEDVQRLADQLQRCEHGLGPALPLRRLAEGLHGFTSRHVSLVLLAACLAVAGLRLA